MRSDFEPITRKLGNGSIEVLPISDVHYGAVEHNAEAWEKLLKYVCDNSHVYVIIGGDMMNNATRSSVSNIFEETVRPRDQKRYMVKALEPIRDKVLCLVPGNHERRSVKDADDEPLYDIACCLDLEEYYRPNIAFMCVQLGDKGDGYARENYKFAVTHGAGGGIYTGATVNRNERFGNIIEGIDVLLVGHTHKGTVSRPSKIVFDIVRNTVYQKEYVVMSMVSWMSYGGYAAQKMLLPSTYSQPQRIILKDSPTHDKKVEVIW